VTKTLLASLCLLSTPALATAESDALAKGFQDPPASAKPHTWWHWMNGNVTKAGITADLEAMARVGIGGAQIFNASEGIPQGPVAFNSPEWRDMVKHAASEASRLGLELCIHNCAGWSSSGGPWNTPEHGMQVLTTSERRVQGPSHFEGALPQPPAKLDFYRDIAVLAFRTPVGEGDGLQALAPKVTTSVPKVEGKRVCDGDDKTAITLPVPQSVQKPEFIQFEFAQPYPARLLTIQTGPGMLGCEGKIEASDDGKTFHQLAPFVIPRIPAKQTFIFSPVSARFYRLSFTRANVKTARIVVAEVELSDRTGIAGFAAKAFLERGRTALPEPSDSPAPQRMVSSEQVVDLTEQMHGDKLAWDVPEGDWTILRMGYTPNGQVNHPAPKEGVGLECDKLSKEAVEAHWAGSMAPLLDTLGPLAGKSFNNVLIDSYEVGTQTWTEKFRDEFQKRRGYDIGRFLPVLSGRIVDSPQVTDRFLWDYRRTISDLFSENYAGTFAGLAHKNGLLFSLEPYGNNCPSDDMQYGGYADIPMTEFWPGGAGGSIGNAKLAASIAHMHGRKFVGAEAFTAAPEQGKWLKDPFSLKAQGDLAWCAGVNRFIFHRYAMQPWTDPTRYPGMTMGQWGTHFERTTTWWEQSTAWLKYIARSQYLLQSGRFVADVCFFNGEDAPSELRITPLPRGYDFDVCDTATLALMTVQDGRIALPNGMTYRLLALPSGTTMTPATLRKIKALADAGATIVGQKPTASPGLTDYPKCDEEVRQLAADAKILTDRSPAEALADLHVPPDFESATPSVQDAVFIHRIVDEADVYFVSNQQAHSVAMDGVFRVSGKLPELWHADTGCIEQAPVWREENGRTVVPLTFDPAGSVFVVFRKPAPADHLVAAKYTTATAAPDPGPLTILTAEYGVFDPPRDESVDVTAKLREKIQGGVRHIVADNQLAGDPADGTVKELRIVYREGNAAPKIVTVEEDAAIDLPAGAGVIRAVYGALGNEQPAPGKTVDLSAQLSSLIKDGRLSVKVSNKLADRDPAPGIEKAIHVTYRHHGIEKTVRVPEQAMLDLPEGDSGGAIPAYRLALNGEGHAGFYATQPGQIEVQTASGKTMKAVVTDMAKPIDVGGPWELNFPPNWGAPAQVTLEKLISWTEHPDTGVKYFSGTATYVKDVEIPAELLGDGRSLWLDLGQVENIAEVSMNGKPLGILWKPPFRADITGTAKPGANRLEIKITNLWPNRLIGDEQLPPDCEWNPNLAIKEWPKWLLEGKPSPTGRLTFTTWHHWKKDDALLPSGLLGPVTLSPVVKAALE